ncbi:metal ABC transporter permease [uncultured Bartonella sp.]|uniref:metal ABC transporter permease n=1 Tax=uncultured Bartonella sp. TaxID=104108 RepID=UPI00260BBD60|nr:metal ABC transporter permease [uncultured Bartonella sp.]
MLDDYLLRALFAGIGVALMAGPLGCFIVWQRLAYFGDTMSHSALLGVAFALLVNIDTSLGVFLVAALVSVALFILQANEKLSGDSLLGILSHATLAIGLILIGFMTWTNIDINSYLFGDILAVSRYDLITVWVGCMVILVALIVLWRPLLALTINKDMAQAENMKPDRARFIFMLLLAVVIAVAINIIGILLITALLIIPAATARRFSSTPEQMAVLAAIIGVVGTILGLYASIEFDSRSGPSVVVALFILFIFSRLISALVKELKHDK